MIPLPHRSSGHGTGIRALRSLANAELVFIPNWDVRYPSSAYRAGSPSEFWGPLTFRDLRGWPGEVAALSSETSRDISAERARGGREPRARSGAAIVRELQRDAEILFLDQRDDL